MAIISLPRIRKWSLGLPLCAIASVYLLFTQWYLLQNVNRTIPVPAAAWRDYPAGIADNTSTIRNQTRYQNRAVHSSVNVNYTILYRKEFQFSSLLSSENDSRHKQKDNWLETRNATREVVSLAPELFHTIPRHFSEDFKNPCWVRGETNLNCLPYFYVIGMYKCGTTDIWDKIVAHPDVINVPKEPHWWGPRRNGWTETPIHKQEVLRTRQRTGGKDDSSLEWYLNFYKAYAIPKLLDNSTRTSNGRKYYQKVFGDASISTAYTLGTKWLEMFPNATEPPYTNADLIHALQPQAKIIMMVRNPTARADSWYWYSSVNHQRKYSSELWHAQASRRISIFNECLRSHSLRYCAYYGGPPYEFIPDTRIGIYHVFLSDWIRKFSRNGVMVIRLEDWRSDPVSIYRKLLEFLELRPLSEEKIQSILKLQKKNALPLKNRLMWPKTKRALDDFFRPYNEELAKLMNDTGFLYE